MLYYSVVDLSVKNGQGVYALEVLRSMVRYNKSIVALVPRPSDEEALAGLTDVTFIFLPTKRKNRSIFYHFTLQIYSLLIFYRYRNEKWLVYSLKPMMFSTLIAKFFGINTVVLVEGVIEKTIQKVVPSGLRALAQRLVRQNLKNSNIVIPAYDEALRMVNSIVGPCTLVHMIRCGVDHRIFRPLRKSNNIKPPSIAYVGSFNKRHCLELLIEYIRVNQNVQADLIGNGAEEKSIRELVLNNGLSDRVRFHGAMPPAQFIPILDKSSICWGVIDNTCWGVPIKIYEYLALEKPVIMRAADDFEFLSTPGVIKIESADLEMLLPALNRFFESSSRLDMKTSSIIRQIADWDLFGSFFRKHCE